MSSVMKENTAMPESTSLDETTLVLMAEHVRHIMMLMDFDSVEITCSIASNETLQINIEAGESGKLLIGNKGCHLAALQHVMRAVLRKHMSKSILIVVDVNGYRARRESSLFNLAENAARKAQRTGTVVCMEPMTAADRRTIHAALANWKDVRTESTGDDLDRKVVVEPVFL